MVVRNRHGRQKIKTSDGRMGGETYEEIKRLAEDRWTEAVKPAAQQNRLN